MTDHYNYRVSWSAEDNEYVGVCFELPGLSWLDEDPAEAFAGIRRLVAETVADMRANGEAVAEPVPVREMIVWENDELRASLFRGLAEAAEERMARSIDDFYGEKTPPLPTGVLPDYPDMDALARWQARNMPNPDGGGPVFPVTPPTAEQVDDAESAAALMIRAANRIDSHVLHETWDYDQFEEDGPYLVFEDKDWDDDADMPLVATLGKFCVDQARAAWIARFGPQIARPLADVLRAGAVDATAIGPDFRLVELAKVIVGRNWK